MYCIFKCEGIEKMEEKQGCEFCLEEKEIKRCDGDFNFTFTIPEESKMLWSYDEYLSGGCAVSINYCPMCGRKL